MIVAEVVIRVHLVQIQAAKNNGLRIYVLVMILEYLVIFSVRNILKVISHSLETVYSWLLDFVASADQYGGVGVGVSNARVIEAGVHHVKFLTHQVFCLLNLLVDWTHHVPDLETHTTHFD